MAFFLYLGHGIIHRDAILFLLKSVFGWDMELLKWGASEKIGWTSIVKRLPDPFRTARSRFFRGQSTLRYIRENRAQEATSVEKPTLCKRTFSKQTDAKKHNNGKSEKNGNQEKQENDGDTYLLNNGDLLR